MSKMRRWIAACGLVSGTALGCQQTEQYNTEVPVREEWRVAPDEARFNEPPEKRWVKPPPKKEFRPGFGAGSGAGGPGMGGMGGPGF